MSRLSLLLITNVKSISIIFAFLLLFSCSSDDTTEVDEQMVTNTTASIVEVTNVSENMATISGTAQAVQGSSILAKGIAWGTNTNPTVETDFSTDEGTNSGDFIVTISDLVDNTQYHVRAYVTTDVATIYSNDQTFTTLDLCDGSNVYTGDNIFLDTQADVEAFGAMGYCEVEALIRIGTIITTEDRVTDISSLASIKKVEGIVINNTLLQDLDDLENLQSSEVISLFNNLNLTNIDGLSNVNSPVRKIRVSEHPLLTNIDALSNLSAATDGQIDDISISNNMLLKNINGLSGITRWKQGVISVQYNPMLENIDGFQNLTTLESVLVLIEGNENLPNIDGLQNLVDATSSSFNIRFNDNLQNLNGLSNIRTEIDAFIMQNQPNITDFASLTNILFIGSLYLKDNPSLLNLEGLSSLSFNSIEIEQNPSLQNLNGLQGIDTNLTRFNIWNNTQLTDFCSLTGPFSTISIGNYNVEANAYNPTQQDIIDGNCSQ